MKWLVKMFCPSAKTLAGYAADAIAKSVNESSADVKECVAKYAMYAVEATDVATTLAQMAKDGDISKTDRDALQAMLAPLFDKVLALV